FESADALRVALQAYLAHRGSALLVAGAQARLGELQLALAAENHDEIYRLFGAARFGFHEALVPWRGNDPAMRGLEQATSAVASYELAHGDAHAAVTLLGELEQPPELIERAKRAAAEQAQRRAHLEKVEQAHDLAIGRRARAYMGLAMGLFFAVLPLIP